MFAGLVGSGGGGLTALMFAAREGDLESAEALLDAGAPINQTTEYGWTPLLTAVNNRNYKLASSCSTAAPIRTSPTRAAGRRSISPPTTATSRAATTRCPKPDMDHLEIIKLLLDKGASPNAR